MLIKLPQRPRQLNLHLVKNTRKERTVTHNFITRLSHSEKLFNHAVTAQAGGPAGAGFAALGCAGCESGLVKNPDSPHPSVTVTIFFIPPSLEITRKELEG